MLVFLPAPIYKVKYVRDHIWVLASTRALLEKKKKKKKKIKKKKKKKKKELSSSLPSRKFLNYRKILFLSKVMVVFLPAPIYKVKYVRDGTDR